MAKPLLPDELWEIIEPLLPKWTPSPKGGHPRLDDRKALTGILFVLKTGIPWEDLPCEMGCGCGMTCWRRLRDWQADGTWDKIHKVLLDKLRGADKIDWSRALIDSSFVRAAYGGEGDRPQPGGPGQARQQAPRDHRRLGHPAGRLGDGGQRQRHHRVGPAVQQAPAGGRQGRPPEEEARRLAGGPGLRLRAAPPGAAGDGRRAGPAREGDRRPERVWGRPAGRWSGRCPGSTRTGGFGSATSVGRTSIRRSSPWPASRSVRAPVLQGSVRRSNATPLAPTNGRPARFVQGV